MTFVTKVRGAPTGTMLHDYRCAEHGAFEADVPRDDVPDSVPCPAIVGWQSPALTGSEPATPTPMTCAAASPWAPTPVTGRVKLGEVHQGKVMDYPPERVCLDTRALADGMPMHEWRAKQEKITRDISLERSRARRR